LNPKEPKIELNESEIRALYGQGEEAVVSLVRRLLEQVKKLESRIEELGGRAKKTSSNSSKPPPGDGFGKKTKSLRSKSDRASGGQKGHQGQTLEWSNEVDEVERHQVSECVENRWQKSP
jgi:transposase